MSRILSLLLVFAFTGVAQAQPEPLVKKVKTSIAEGVAFVVSQQRDDGSWEEPKDKDNASQYQGGPTALALLALLNCEGVLLDQPQLEAKRTLSIQNGLANLRAIESPKVYVRALQTMALAEAGNPKDRAQIKRNVDWLLEARVYKDGKFIGWQYENRKGIKDSDASNSQYAMLALWYGRQAGIPINRKVWEEIRDYYTLTQNKDGSWIYSLDYAPNDEKGPSATMTVAGLCGLLIAGQELNADREQWQPNGQFKNCGDYHENAPAARALQWIGKNFNVEIQHRTFYHLYGLERAGRLSGQRFFGEHDWYREGCEYLTKTQAGDGSWQIALSRWDRWPHVNTSFALLFLSKGRTPVLISKLVHGAWGIKGRDENDLDWNNDRNDLRHLTEYLARSTDMFGKKPLGWQTYDIRRAVDARGNNLTPDDEAAIVADMLQAPILYVTGHLSPEGRLQGVEKKLIKRYVENGGFIFAEACCDRKAFDDGIKELVKDIWDGNELTYVDSSHPVWTSENKIQPGEPYKLLKLEVGCRTVMLYSPQDLSCYWESNRDDGNSTLAFRLGANIVAYATGRTSPQPRLTPVEIASGPKDMKEPRARGAFQVMQVRYSSDWQPAPKAMTNLMEHVHKATGLDVKLKTGQLLLSDQTSVGLAKFLYMHGKGKFLVANDHLPALRFTLEHGGLLLADACCGDEAFDKSFRKFTQQLFPNEKLVRVPSDEKNRDRIFDAKLNNDDVLSANTGIVCRVQKGGKMLPMDPYLEGIQIDGRWVVLYSKYDIGCALERSQSSDCVGYDHASALRIATAAVRYNTRP